MSRAALSSFTSRGWYYFPACAQLLSRVWLFVTPWTVACPWDFPGKNTGVGCHFLLQGIFLTQELKMFVHAKTYTDTYSGSICKRQNRKQPWCPSEGEWTNRPWSVQTKEIWFTTKNKLAIKPWKTLRKLKCAFLSERGRSEKATACDSKYITS